MGLFQYQGRSDPLTVPVKLDWLPTCPIPARLPTRPDSSVAMAPHFRVPYGWIADTIQPSRAVAYARSSEVYPPHFRVPFGWNAGQVQPSRKPVRIDGSVAFIPVLAAAPPARPNRRILATVATGQYVSVASVYVAGAVQSATVSTGASGVDASQTIVEDS